jgi:uncharacterized protein (TIGR01777 family)
MRVAVTGATGFVGRALCAELRRGGHRVVALTRDPQRAQTRLPGVETVAWNASQEELPAVDAIVNLAGESLTGRWSDAKKQRIRDSRVDGTRRLVEAIGRASPRPGVLISGSAVGVYGDRGEETLTEASSLGNVFLARVCQEWYEEAQRALEWGVRVVKVRLGVVLDRDGGALAQMLTPFRLGVGGPLGSGRQWFPWIHRADAAGLVCFALQRSEVTGALNAVAPEPVRNGEFARALGRALHRPALLPAPSLALRLLLGEFADTLLGSQRVVPERARSAGYAYQYPGLTSALHAILSPTANADVPPEAPL